MTALFIGIYVVVQILFLPLAIVGVALVAYRQMWTSRKLGVSSTAIEVINGRWTMDVFGLRADSAARALNPALPNNSVWGLWMALFPLYLLYRLSGKNLFYPRIPKVGEEGLADIVTARTIYFDEMIAHHSGAAEQFVLLGAGFDTRAYGDLVRDDLQFFELDQPQTQRLKTACLSRAGLTTDRVIYLEIDFANEDWAMKLAQSSFDPDKLTIFLWEGVTLYLSETQVCQTLEKIRANSTPGSVVIADFYALSFVEGDYVRGMKSAKNALKLTGEEFGFGVDFAADHKEALGAFIEGRGLKLGGTRFLAEDSSSKGPFMVVTEVLV